jgi:hypothetical protein
MSEGVSELLAAALAGLVVVVVADFLFTSATTGGWFAPGLGGSGAPALGANPPTVAGGGIPATSVLAAPVTC